MDKNNKVLMMAILILAVAVVSFNVVDLTGKSVGGQTAQLMVSPEMFVLQTDGSGTPYYNTQQAVTVTLVQGKVNTALKILDATSGAVVYENNLCSSSKCTGPLSKTVYATLAPGTYTAKVTNTNNGESTVSNSFLVTV